MHPCFDSSVVVYFKPQRYQYVLNISSHLCRFLKHGKLPFNYGFLPQTWEDPSHLIEETGHPGDNDPIDLVEIGQRVPERGEVIAVKPLGVLALLDEGETDWKVIAIDTKDPLAKQLNGI